MKEQKNLNIFVEPRVRAELLSELSYYNFVQTWEDGKFYDLLNFSVEKLSSKK